MRLELVLCLVNLVLTFAIAARLELHKSGIFSIGFFSLGTGIFPHYVLMPLVGVLTANPLASRESFGDGLLVVTTLLTGLLIGVLTARKRTAPFFSRIPNFVLPLRAHFILLGIGLVMVAALSYFLAGTMNPFVVMSKTKSVEFRVKHEEFDLGYPILLTLGTLLFSHGWLVVRLLSQGRKPVNLIVAMAVTAVAMLAAACMGSRSALFFPLLVFLFAAHHFYHRIPTTLVIAIFVVSIPAFVFSRLVGSGWDVNNLPRETSLSFIGDEFIHRFNLFDGLLDFLDWFRHKPFAYGETLLDILVRPIPRQFMPDKPQSMDVFLTYQIFGRPYYGGGVQLFGAPGEMYYNFGYVGVFFWFIVLGRITYRFHYGLEGLLRDKRTLASTMIITNHGLLRGLTNCGINTIATQQILVTLLSQLVFCGGMYAVLRLMTVFLNSGKARRAPPIGTPGHDTG